MFLTKKAEELFDSILKQAKKALEKEPELEAKGEDLNTEELNKANTALNDIRTEEGKTPEEKTEKAAKQIATGKDAGSVIKALVGLSPEEITRLQALSDTAKEIAETNKREQDSNQNNPNNENNTSKPTEPTEHTTGVDSGLNDVLIPGEGEDTTSNNEETEDPLAGLFGGNTETNNEKDKPFETGASFMEYLHKRAEEATQTEPIQTTSSTHLSGHDVNMILANIDSNGDYIDEQEHIITIPTYVRNKFINGFKELCAFLENNAESSTQEDVQFNDARCSNLAIFNMSEIPQESKEDIFNKAKEIVNAKNAGTLDIMSSINSKTELLNAVANYEPEPTKDEFVIQLAKSSSNSLDFLKKMAAELDEQPAGKQYPGQKMFDNNKNVSYSDGNTPKYPSQQILSTRDGGNGKVVTLFPDTKPEVDVYNDKKGRETLVKIKDGTDVTIAFVQPVGEIAQGFDYTGFVTGSESLNQKGEQPAPQAVAGHEAMSAVDFNQKIIDNANKPAQQAGIPTARASVKNVLNKTASNDEDEEYSAFVGENPNQATFEVGEFTVKFDTFYEDHSVKFSEIISIEHNGTTIGSYSYDGADDRHVDERDLLLRASDSIKDPKLKEQFKKALESKYDSVEKEPVEGEITPTSSFNFNGIKKKKLTTI